MIFVIEATTSGVTIPIYDSSSSDPVYCIGNPIVKLEVSKAGSLSFSILPTHPAYDSFHRMSTYVTVYQDGDVLFHGRVLDINDSTYMERNITCEGDLAFLNDSLQPPDKNYEINEELVTSNESQRQSLPAALRPQMPSETVTVVRVPSSDDTVTRTVKQQFTTYIQIHNSQMPIEKQFMVGNVTVTSKDESVDWDSTSYRLTKSAIDSDLITYYGGYLQVRHEDGKAYIDWLKNPGSTSNQALTLGVNIIDIQKQNKGNEIYTRLVPVGKDHITLDNQNDHTSGADEILPYIEKSELVNEYGIIYKTISYSSVDDKSKLYSLAQDYMDDNCKEDPISLTIKAIDMNILDGSVEKIQVGQRVNVVSEPHGISIYLNVISIEYDIQNPENNTYEIGDPSETLTQKVDSDSDSSSSSSSSTANSLSNLENAANRHAANIIDIADKSYTLQADTITINARVITIEADLLEIHTEALTIQSGTVTLTADYAVIGNVIMGGNGDYEVNIAGSTMITGSLNVGGWLYGDLDGKVLYNDGLMSQSQDIGSAILSFGTATSSNGVITIPYTSINGTQGSITFNMASTAFYQNAVEAAWNNGGKTAYVKDVPYVSTYGNPLRTLDPGQKRAIRAYYVDNDGDTDSIPVQSGNRTIIYPIEARALNLQTRTVTANNTYTPASGYDGIGSITVAVPERTVNLQTKTITSNNTYLPDSGYDGFGKVIVNVPERTINLQTLTVTSNNTYTPASGYDGIGSITVAVPSQSIDPSDIHITGVTYDPTNYSGTKAEQISSIVHGNSTGYCMFTVSVDGVTKQYYISLAG